MQNSISGTSMASPHIAGLAAYLAGLGNGRISPQALCNNMREMSLKNALSGIPSGTVNMLANNGVNKF